MSLYERILSCAPDGGGASDLTRDPLVVARCATEIATSGEPPPPEVTTALRNANAAWGAAPASAFTAELTLALVGRDVPLALQWLHDVGWMARFLPELHATVDFSQEAGRKHKDVWEHTKQVVQQSVPRPEVRWGALLHDIGKVPTRKFLPDGAVTFHGHAEVGARMFGPVAQRFGFERPASKKIRFLILHHLRPGQYQPSWTDSAVRRFTRELDEYLPDLLDLSRADITSKRPGRRQALVQQIHDLSVRIEDLRALDAKQPPLPTGLGLAIMARFGVPQTKQLGDLIKELKAACERGELEERREDDYYLDWIATHGLV
ncbi:MAG: HD domain-containing protein [Myxococcales bacterium]|nr:HD domain-containing protein [Myxococcales bacterium]